IPPNGRGHHRQRPKPFLLGKQSSETSSPIKVLRSTLNVHRSRQNSENRMMEMEESQDIKNVKEDEYVDSIEFLTTAEDTVLPVNPKGRW
ncbi:unnamed protein product, partial [Allacma fusca]